MKKAVAKIPHFFKRHKIISIINLIAIIMFCWWGVVNYMPHPLGKELVYLGKKDYGGLIFGDSDPASIYYYGTDLEPNDMKQLFTARYSPSDVLAFKNASFSSTDGDFMFTYETNDIPFVTSKKYVVSIGNWGYGMAKKYLKK